MEEALVMERPMEDGGATEIYGADNLLESLFYTAFDDQLQAKPAEPLAFEQNAPQHMLATVDNTVALRREDLDVYTAVVERAMPSLMQTRVDSLFDSYFAFKKEHGQTRYFVEKLVEARIEFKLPNSYSFLQNEIDFKLPEQLYDFHQDSYKVPLRDKIDGLSLWKSDKQRLFFEKCTRVNHILRFYLDRLVGYAKFDQLKALCFVNIEDPRYDDRMLIFPQSDPDSKAYQTLLIPFVYIYSNVGDEKELFLTSKKLYKQARLFGYMDTYQMFLQLLQISLKRIFNIIAASRQAGCFFHCNPHLLLAHIIAKNKAFHSSPVQQLFERGVLPSSVLLCMEQQNNSQLLTDGFYFLHSRTVGFQFALNQKAIICMPEIQGFRNAYQCQYEDQVSASNCIVLTPHNVRDGSAFKLGNCRFPAFYESLQNLRSGERAIHCAFAVWKVFDGVAIGGADDKIYIIQNTQLAECGRYDAFIVSVAESEYFDVSGRRLPEIRCREFSFAAKLPEARDKWVEVQHALTCEVSVSVSLIDAEKKEAVGDCAGRKCYLRGFQAAREGAYRLYAFKMADRADGLAFRALEAKKDVSGAYK